MVNLRHIRPQRPPARPSWRTDERGSLVPLAAGAVLVLTVVAFGALDFHNATLLRSNLQDTLDATTLAVARSPETDSGKLQKLGADLLRQGLHKSASGATLRQAEFDVADGVVHGSAEISFRPVIAGLVTGKTIKMSATSHVAPGDALEVALVLDNTYSMLGARIGTLKNAATSFVTILEKAAKMNRDEKALKISLVPFATTVNVGSAYRYAAWMDTAAKAPTHDDIFNTWANRFTLFSKIQTNWAGCVEARQHPYDVQETAPTATTPATLFVPYFAPDEPDAWNYGWTNDYLPDDGSGEKGIGKYDQAPKTTAMIGSGYRYGPNYECTLQPLVRLTTDTAKIKNAISTLTVAGDTNIPMGLMWGWHTLSPNAPFADGATYTRPKTKKIAVLMTDGQNALYNNYGPNESIYSAVAYIKQGRLGITTGTELQRRAALDARLTMVCNNMKAKGVIIYTVRLEVTEGSADVLRNCATTPAMFHDVKRASELTETFETIARDINRIRIAR